MNEEAKFLQRLNEFIELAKASGSQITIEEVKAYFLKDALTEEQMELVFEYLMAQKISVKGYVKIGEETEIELTEEERQYLTEYEKELTSIPSEQPGEIKALIPRILKGDVAAKARLVEIYMDRVVDTAKELHQLNVFIGDLIQEGNLGLVIGVEMITEEEDVDDIMLGQMRQCMQLLLEEQSELASRDKKMVEKVQTLDESITALTEELGRKVTIDELAVYMGMEVEEIEDILKLAGEDTELEEQNE